MQASRPLVEPWLPSIFAADSGSSLEKSYATRVALQLNHVVRENGAAAFLIWPNKASNLQGLGADFWLRLFRGVLIPVLPRWRAHVGAERFIRMSE